MKHMRMGAMEWYRRGLRDGIPIGLGYLAVSFTLGIAARSDGLTAVQATVMSLLNLTSAGQFAGLTVIAAGASYLEMAASQLIINPVSYTHLRAHET